MSKFTMLLAFTIAVLAIGGGTAYSADGTRSEIALVDDGGNEWG